MIFLIDWREGENEGGGSSEEDVIIIQVTNDGDTEKSQ